jgi:hypothetical protein
MLKTLKILGLILFAIGLLLAGIYLKLHHDLKPSFKYPAVVAVQPTPPSKHLRIAPYQGSHPSRWRRPTETFKFPIDYGDVGPSIPLFAGPPQYPFACMTESTGLGQPVVDNQQGWGVPVYHVDQAGNKTSERIGFSQDCGLTTQAIVIQRNDQDKYSISPLFEAPKLLNKKNVDTQNPNPWGHGEAGTINRYLYTLLIPAKDYQSATEQSLEAWNGHLIYYFQGGVSIGFRQGSLKIHKIANTLKDLLQAGYAIATSTGNATSSTYDIWIAEDTLSRVVQQFSQRFSKPKRIIGVGGSGGAIQQYLISQNHPGLLDAGVALYSYPDMATQIPGALDCELLEYYFDRLTANPERWSHWSQRKWIEGMNSIDHYPSRYRWYQPWINILNGEMPSMPKGASTCSQSWRGTADQFNNPNFNIEYQSYSPEVRASTHWTHWENLKRIYGTNNRGYAHSLFDNQGVQYGLKALKQGIISVAEFLDINAKIGGWLPQHSMRNSQYWVLSGEPNLRDLSLWSEFNMTHRGLPQWPAPRSIANPLAVEAAFRSGMVFTGKLRMPMIDLRHYLDDNIDMHYSWASFSIRKRIQASLGQHQRQVIWMTQKPHFPLVEAVEALQDWLDLQDANPLASLVTNRPSTLKDSCYTSEGKLIASGPEVWDGHWNQKPTGACLKTYPNYANARQIAGDDILGLTFICQLIPVREAISKGVYAPIDISEHIQELERIFPKGVCDYQQPGQGFPFAPEAWPYQ